MPPWWGWVWEMNVHFPSLWIVWFTAIKPRLIVIIHKVLAVFKVGSCARHTCERAYDGIWDSSQLAHHCWPVWAVWACQVPSCHVWGCAKMVLESPSGFERFATFCATVDVAASFEQTWDYVDGDRVGIMHLHQVVLQPLKCP